MVMLVTGCGAETESGMPVATGRATVLDVEVGMLDNEDGMLDFIVTVRVREVVEAEVVEVGDSLGGGVI